ncbi:unnamed protein product [Rotaria sp. Silwood1]|nr:unnamed protein product [Rotaria sp. Silwood1]CAF0864182.1 unnamed protein product [Rotaria sp. Silwood1]CAF3380322.1 unnamed protein product [Rotaria sp. Silwood1]CAF4518791.1 unnamed protein product [Rotaria sp. Silwood1]
MSSNIPRNLNKNMRKRQQFDSPMKFHITKSNSNDVFRSSEEELFIPHRKIPITNLHSSGYLLLWTYSQHILSFSLVCIVIIVCFSLTYASIELKNEVQSLSSRISEIEKKFLNTELNHSLPVIEQIKTRVQLLENWNFSFIYNHLQKLQVQMLLNNFILSNLQKIEHNSAHLFKTTNELNNLNREMENRIENTINKSIVKSYEQFNLLQNEIQSFNQNIKIEELTKHLEQLTNLVHNSSDEVGFFYFRLMSIKRRQLFVGVLDNETWTNEKLCAYFNKHASANDEQYITDCQIMSYSEARFQGKSFAFITFTDEACVDRCMTKRTQFNNDYGITIKRLLPDSITKCERLMSSTDIVIRITLQDPLFTETNIRSYFGVYGKITELKMLEEDDCAGICFITFEDFDSSDRVLLDFPHYLNGQLLSIHKYTAPEYICNLSQFRFVDPKNASQIKRWYPIFRNLTDFMRPLKILYKTQIALFKFNMNKQISISNQNLNKTKETLHEFENKYNDLKQNFLQLFSLNEQLKRQIQELERKNEKNKNEYENQIEEQKRKNQSLQDAIMLMSLSSDSKDRQRHELYVGVFHKDSWTSKSLCEYFHRLIKGSCITECHFYSCANAVLNDYCFAILTFASISSVDQCLAKRPQINREHRFIVKRNLREVSKDQRPVTKYILIHLDKFDLSFNNKNVLAYFGKYGSIFQWKILDNGRTFLLNFEDYDSVDRIFLDEPHFVNQHYLSIRKCYNPYARALNNSMDDRLKEQIRNLQASIDRSKYKYESELMKLNKQIKEEIAAVENRLSDTIKSCIRLERIQRDLKQDLMNARQINQQLKNKLEETIEKKKKIVDEFENQLEQQRYINKLLNNSILNFS